MAISARADRDAILLGVVDDDVEDKEPDLDMRNG